MLVACNFRKGPFFAYDKIDYKGSSDGIHTNPTFLNTRMCGTIPNGYIENRSPFSQPQSLSQGSYFTYMPQETVGNNNFGGFNMFNTVYHDQMQQLTQVTNNYVLQRKNEHNDIEEEMNIIDL